VAAVGVVYRGKIWSRKMQDLATDPAAIIGAMQ
jgi:hypothetical protein